MKRLVFSRLLLVGLVSLCLVTSAFAAGSQHPIGSIQNYLESLGIAQPTDGDMLEYTLDYSSMGVDWTLEGRSTYDWDGQGRPTTILDETWTGSAYVNDYLTTTTYDATGAIETLNQDWDGGWVNQSRSLFENDGEQRPVVTISQTWNGSDWDNQSRSRITYESGMMTAEIYSDIWEEGAWVEVGKIIYSYDGGHASLLMVYSKSGEDWVEVSRTTFTYSGDLLQETVTDIWLAIPPDPGSWVGSSRSTYSYEGGLLVEVVYDSYSAFVPPIGWSTTGRNTYEYDGQGRETVSIYQTYSATALAWTNTSKTESFYEAAAVQELEGYPLPERFSLAQNYPNPFNPTTQIRFALTSSAQVTLEVFDVRGRKVGTLVDETLNAGTHQVDFNASGLASGVYFYRLRTADFEQTRKMLLIK